MGKSINSLLRGMVESFSFLLWSQLSPNSIILLLFINFLYSQYLHRNWNFPSFKQSRVLVKIGIGGLLRLLIFWSATNLSFAYSPILQNLSRLLATEPAHYFINQIIALVQGTKQFSEIFGTSLVLLGGSLMALLWSYGLVATGLAVVWSYMRNMQSILNRSMKKQESNFDSYVNATALIGGSFFVFTRLAFSSGYFQELVSAFTLEGLICALLISVVANSIPVAVADYKHYLGYIVSFFCLSLVTDLSLISGFYLLTNVIIVILQSYDIQELPLNSSPTGLLVHICSHQDSRRLSLFLLQDISRINLLFMFVEAAYGYWCNSLGLISDSIHMAFDCTALAIGLYASYISKFPPDQGHPYGYSRYQVLSGYINGILLVFVGLNILIESIQRILEPPEVQTEMLMLVSVLGLVVNIIGLFFFQQHHGDNSNLQGVFFHILADTLGSVGVIISSVFVYTWQWYIADPICSLIISALILMSVIPLLQDSMKVLLERDTEGISKSIKRKLEDLPGVKEVAKMHVWKLSGTENVAMVWVKAEQGAEWIQLTQLCKEVLPEWNSVQIVEDKQLI